MHQTITTKHAVEICGSMLYFYFKSGIMKRIVIGILITICMVGCKWNDTDYFNGTIQIIKDIPNTIKLEGEKLSWVDDNGFCNGRFVVHDSLAIFFNPTLPSAFFAIGDLKSKRSFGPFCLKGRGPIESISLHPIYEVFEEVGQLKAVLFAPNEDRFMIWNISESLLQKTTIFDSIIPFKWRLEVSSPFLNIYPLNSNEIIAYVLPKENGNNAASLPYYQALNMQNSELKKKLGTFIKPIHNLEMLDFQAQLFRSQDCIKPDNTKIAQSMSYLNQLNIVDISSGDVTGFRVEDTPNFSIFVNKMSHADKYYCDSCADDNYIYSLYAGNPIFPEDGKFKQARFLHVFNWEGQLVGKYDLGHEVDNINIDRQNNLLYAINVRTEEFYKYNLSDLRN